MRLSLTGSSDKAIDEAESLIQDWSSAGIALDNKF